MSSAESEPGRVAPGDCAVPGRAVPGRAVPGRAVPGRADPGLPDPGSPASLPSGRVLAVCVGLGGVPKPQVPVARATPDGIEGDGHRYELHGGRDRALCLLFEDEAAALTADGAPCTDYGRYGENLRIGGLRGQDLRPGQRLAIGPELVAELFDLREPCRVLTALDPRFPDRMLGRSGFVARVLHPGPLRPGDPVTLLAGV